MRNNGYGSINRRGFLRGSALTGGGLLVASTLGAGKAWASTPLRLGSFFVAIDYAPYLIAKANGAYEEMGGASGVEFTMFQSLPPINESFGTGRIDAVFEAEPPALIGAAAGIDVKIVGISCTLVQEILVPATSSAQSAGDLRGAKIAVLAGTSSHYGVAKILEAEGISVRDVEIIDMIPPDAKSAFQTGQVDAWAVWPPFVEQEEIDGTGRVLPRGDAVIHSIMAVSGSLIQDSRETVQGLVDILNTTKAWMIANPEQAMEIVATELDIDLAVVERAWPRHDWGATLNEAVIADIQAKADFLYDGDYVGNKVNASEVVDTSFG
ncbi:MAG: aliphatic sulfonate ABC transporter substrate-binding protein [Pseudomonadota bacterium]